MILRFVLAAMLALVLLVTLVASIPARIFALVLPAGQVVMEGFSGTVWSGSASRCMMRLPAGYLHLGAVQWSLDPASLLLLAPRVQLSSNWGAQVLQGELTLRGARDLDVNDLQGAVSADLLRQFAPVALSGNFSLQVESLQLRDGLPYSGAGRLLWQGGAWLSPRGPVALGDYALDFQQEADAALQGKVVTLNGPLKAEGELQLANRHYGLNLWLSGDDNLDAQLRDALSLIAAPEGNGYRLNLEGDF